MAHTAAVIIPPLSLTISPSSVNPTVIVRFTQTTSCVPAVVNTFSPHIKCQEQTQVASRSSVVVCNSDFTAMASTLPENLTREQYVYLAKLAEQAERYEEMVKFMEKLVIGWTSMSELTVEERNLLSVAYKNVIGSLRAAWRIVSSIEQKEESRKNEEHVALVKDYRSTVETELSEVCAGILKLLDSHLIPSASTSESKVFYMKMKGDYHRYLAEFKVGNEKKDAAEETMLAYKSAQVLLASVSFPRMQERNYFKKQIYFFSSLIVVLLQASLADYD